MNRGFRLILINPRGSVSSRIDIFDDVVEFPDTDPLRKADDWSKKAIVSYNSVLQSFGLDNPKLMFARLKLWERIFTEHDPVLVIGDFAPIALIVARNHGIATLAMGNGYTLPPTDIPSYPKFVDQPDPVSADKLMVSFNQALKLAKMKELSALPEIFRANINACFTDPMIDPFAKYRGQPAIGPLFTGPIPKASLGGKNKAFVYLTHCNGDTHRLVLDAVRASKINADIYSLQATRQVRQAYQSAKINMLEGPIGFDDICKNYGMAIHLGGHGFTLEFLYAGIPQILLPKDMEKILYSLAMMNNGYAHRFRVDYPRPLDALVLAIGEASVDKAMAEKVASFAQKVNRDTWQDNQLHILAKALKLIE